MRRRTTYAVLGWLGVVVAVSCLVAGSLLAAVFGPDNRLRSESSSVSGKGAAVIAEQLTVDASSVPLPDGIGTVTIDVDPVGPRAVFVGQASPSDLDTYLQAVPYDVVVALDPGGTAQLRSVPGTALPGPPQQESIWTRQQTGAAGQAVSLRTDLGDRSSLVIMNATPANGVAVDLSVTLTVPWAWRTALVLLGAGVLLLVLSILLLWRSRVAGRRARAERSALARGAHAAPTASRDVLPAAVPVRPVTPAQPMTVPTSAEPSPTTPVDRLPAAPPAEPPPVQVVAPPPVVVRPPTGPDPSRPGPGG